MELKIFIVMIDPYFATAYTDERTELPVRLDKSNFEEERRETGGARESGHRDASHG